MAGVLQDVATSADWISGELRSLGYGADFRPKSLWEIDRFFHENFRDGVPRTRQARRRFASLIDPSGRVFVFALGGYVGEVIRRGLGGQWAADDSGPYAEVSIELQLPGEIVITPMMRCTRMCGGNREDSIARYANELGLDVGRPPEQPSRRDRRRCR